MKVSAMQNIVAFGVNDGVVASRSQFFVDNSVRILVGVVYRTEYLRCTT